MKKNFRQIIYISELNLPNTSAQALQTLKMCSAFANKTETKLIVLNSKKNFKFFKRNYLLKSNFSITGVFKKPKKISFLTRIFFFIKLISLIDFDKKSLIITRSVMISTLLSIYGIKNILELHIENTSFTKLFFKIKFLFLSSKNQKFILISKNLNNFFKFKKNDYIVLDDASDPDDFKVKDTKPKYNSCIYVGSFFEGKGLELITEISKKMPKIKFYLYGKPNSYFENKKKEFSKNIIHGGYAPYNQIPKLLSQHKVCLMPYARKIFFNADNISNEKYISPLKLFDYLSSGKILVASKLESYRHLLIDQENCFLASPDKTDDWVNKLNKIFKNYSNLKMIRRNAKNTAKLYTWNKRAQKIIEFTKLS